METRAGQTSAAAELKVVPFLMFEGKAEEAMRLYTSVLPGAQLLELAHYAEGEGGKVGSVKAGMIVVGGQRLRFHDSAVHHAFTFTPSLSLFVDCASEAEVDRIGAALGAGGQVMMPAGNYGFSKRFAWVSDRFGVSWQLNCP